MAGIWDFTYDQGTDFERSLKLTQRDGITPVNLAGCTFSGQVRLSPQDAAVITMTVTIVDATNGVIKITMSAAESAAIPVAGLRYNDYTNLVYDIEIVDSTAKKRRLLNGTIKMSPEVTKE